MKLPKENQADICFTKSAQQGSHTVYSAEYDFCKKFLPHKQKLTDKKKVKPNQTGTAR
jgi:hypothetical protein